jgi:hypothetical protein
MNRLHRAVTRRDFVRESLGAAASAAFLGSIPAAGQQAARSSRVVLVRDQKALSDGHKVDTAVLRRMLEDALKRSTGEKNVKNAWLSLVKPDDIIGLVATSHLNPTHQELINTVRETLEAAGIPSSRLRMAQGGPSQAKACTALIALPCLKAHWLTGIGTVLKNYIQYSGNASDYHDENNAKLGEIWNLPYVKGKTRIVLVDALRPLCDKGPQADPRYMWPYNGLIAGVDPVAVETISLRIIMQKRQALRKEPWPLQPPPLCVAAADERYHLGTSKMSEIRLEQAGWAQDLLI